jgi:hypothetical protein
MSLLVKSEPDTVTISTFPILELETRAIEETVLYPVLPVFRTCFAYKSRCSVPRSSHTLETLVADWDVHCAAILAFHLKGFFLNVNR